MSFSDSQLAADGPQPLGGAAATGPPESPRSPGDLADAAIDRALRDVPLPNGLITRLGEMVYSVSDEPADRLDWLGC